MCVVSQVDDGTAQHTVVVPYRLAVVLACPVRHPRRLYLRSGKDVVFLGLAASSAVLSLQAAQGPS